MKQYCIFLLLSVFACQCLQAQSNYITISGDVDPKIVSLNGIKEVMISKKISTHWVGEAGESVTVPLSATGRFYAKIPVTDSAVYLGFGYTQSNTQWKGIVQRLAYDGSSQYLVPAYLFQAGDSVWVQFNASGVVSFRGKGSEKLNCQSQVSGIKPVHPSIDLRSFVYRNMKNPQELGRLYKQAVVVSDQTRQLLLDDYRSELPGQAYQTIKADMYAYNQFTLLSMLYSYIDMQYRGDIPVEWMQAHIVTPIDSLVKSFDESVLGASIYMPDMIFKRELFDALILKKNEFTPGRLYNRLKEKYSGALRDKLLYIYFETYGFRNTSAVKPYVDDAIATIQLKDYKDAMMSWKQKKYSAYPFELYDNKNNIHRLKEYKGKVVVLDFWFTGCSWCVHLAKTMHEIYQTYKHNNNIVFLTVSTDDIAVWRKGVAGGKYSSPGMINLHTNGQGYGHPLIRHYGFKGFPEQLIIDKEGELVTSRPPRPDAGEKEKQEFIQLIEDNLKD